MLERVRHTDTHRRSAGRLNCSWLVGFASRLAQLVCLVVLVASADGRMIVTSGFDRTWKAWQVDQTAVKAEAKQEAKQEEAQVKVEPMDATENGVSTAQAP